MRGRVRFAHVYFAEHFISYACPGPLVLLTRAVGRRRTHTPRKE
jgi:hypothetical protein